MIRNLGYLLSFPKVSTDDFDLYVDCGISLLENGYEQDSICILAGYSKPYNFFEIRKIISDLKIDLNIPNFTEEQAIAAFSYHLVERLPSKDRKIEILNRLSDLCIKHDYHKKIYDFYLLYFGLSDLMNRGEPQYYWEGLSLKSSDEIIKNVAETWLEENKQILTLSPP